METWTRLDELQPKVYEAIQFGESEGQQKVNF
ncbi:MAG: hypothetical protein CM1200mP30_14110 [Pseudomonadota bacterium]|nr:MAG: hypothetical protein CM1200mP30_14110 [Pseudomonadota bacterium]